MKQTIIVGLFFALVQTAAALDAQRLIARIRAGDRRVLATVSLAEIEAVQGYGETYFYIPRVIGQKAVRSLFGCFENKNSGVRKICADSMYQLKLNYVHKKFVLLLLKKEKEPAVQMALQDIIVRMNEERFYAARAQRDNRFLMKISYDELSVIADKGVPVSRAFAGEDLAFLGGGLENSDSQVRIFCVKMIGRIGEAKDRAQLLLTNLKKREKLAAVSKEIEISLRCLGGNGKCPDVYLQDEH